MDEGEVQPKGAVEGECLFIDTLPAADIDIAGKHLGYRKGVTERSSRDRWFVPRRSLLGVSGSEWSTRDRHGPPAIGMHARPGFIANASEDTNLPGRFLMKKGQILGYAPWQFAVASDDAILGAGDDDVQEFRHEKILGVSFVHFVLFSAR